MFNGLRPGNRWWGGVAAYATLVLLLSVLPAGPELVLGRLDKAAHLGEYLLFAWLLVQAIRASRMPERDYLIWAWIYATSYGGLIELIQALLPWRSAEWGDAVANAIGAALGVWVGQKIPRRS